MNKHLNNNVYRLGDKEISRYQYVQNICRITFDYLESIIVPGMKLIELRKLCETKMLKEGADSFWYYGIGALIFSGDETGLSISGKQYKTADKIIQQNDIITIDLSPQKSKIWGDFARTIIVQNGKVIKNLNDIECAEWREGMEVENTLHKAMQKFVSNTTTFEDLYYFINNLVVENGYLNLDFGKNFGHSISKVKNKRVYIQSGNKLKLSEVDLFTVEPHIGRENSNFGYKKENIYYFDEATIREL